MSTKRQNKVHLKVDWLMRQHQIYRDSDKRLLMAFWETEGLKLTPEQRAVFMSCTPAESITRQRRILKEKYPASQKIDNKRFEKFIDYKYNRPFEYVVLED